MNKFISLLQKAVYSYEYMVDWEKLNEISLPEKEDLQSLKYGRHNWCRLRAPEKEFMKSLG